jgi:hypothetical protein
MNFINKYFFNFNHSNVPVGSPSSATSSPSAKALMIMNNVHEEARSFSVFGPSDYTGKQHKKANNLLNQFYSQSPSTSETLNRDHYSHLTNSEYLSPVQPDESLETHKVLIVHDKDEDEEGNEEDEDDEEDDSDSETRRPSFTTAASVEDNLTLDLNLVNNSSSSSSDRITDKPLTREKVPSRKLKPRVSPSSSPSDLPPTKDLVNFNSVLINRNEFDLLLKKKLNQCPKQQQPPPPKQPSNNIAVAQGQQNNRFVDPDQQIYFGLNFSPKHSTVRKSPQQQSRGEQPTTLLSPWKSSPSPLPKLNERKRENNTTNNHSFSIFSPSSRSSPLPSLLLLPPPPVMMISEEGVFFCPEGISRQPFTPVRLVSSSSSYSPSSRGGNSSFSPSFTSFFRASSATLASSSSSNSSSLLYLSRSTPTRPVLKRNHDQLQQAATTTTTMTMKTISPFSPLEYSPTPANSPVRDRPTKMRNVAK